MRRGALGLAAALALIVGQGNLARATTCYETAQVNIDCSPKGNAASAKGPPPAPTVNKVGPSLRSALNQKPVTAAERQAIADRINDATQRMDDIATKASGVTDPAAQAALRQQYDAASAEFRRAIGDAEGATTDAAARAQTEDYYQRTAKSLNDRVVADGLYSSAPAVAPAPAQQAGDGLREQIRRSLAPDQAETPVHMATVGCRDDNGSVVKDCFFSLQGGRCLKQTRGNVGWDYAELPTDQCPADVKQAYCNAYPQDGLCPQAKAVAKAEAPAQPAPDATAPQAAFSMNGSDTDAEIRRMIGQTPEEQLLAQLPVDCRQPFKNYLDDVHDSSAKAADSPVEAKKATDSYQELDASQECRDALRQIADANKLGLPVRHLKQLTRNAFGAAMAADLASLAPRQPAAGPYALQDDGYDPQEVLEFGIALLGLASNAAALANAMHGGGGGGFGAVGGAVRTFAPPRQQTRANYPTPAPSHTYNCTMSADNWLTCK